MVILILISHGILRQLPLHGFLSVYASVIELLKLTLSQVDFGTYDFGRNVTFKTYSEADAAFDATNYTGKIKVFDKNGTQVISDLSVSWTTQSSGVGTFAFTSTLKPASWGFHFIELQLTKGGEQISTKPVRVMFRSSPDA